MKLLVAGAFAGLSFASTASLTVIPYPQKVTETEGAFVLPTNRIEKGDVTWKTDAAIPAEGYRLSVTPTGVTAWSSDASGAFYALQTLRQMKKAKSEDGEGKLLLEFPCCEIEDAPRFPYRGFMFDEARHFLGKELVLKTLDLISQAKMNVFHWHLTDDEGWRLELKCHPEVHEKGSVRPRSLARGATYENMFWDNSTYGPYYYTHEDVKEILAYAAERHITVVPEFDVPSHSRALFASHPEFTCLGSNETFRTPWTLTGPQYECFCAANEEGMKFIEDIFEEICALFPSKRIHIGGDEAPPNRWQTCQKCRKLMKDLGLDPAKVSDVRKLQTRMTHRFAKFLADRGREAVAWDEVLSKDMPTNLVLQIWHHGNDARLAAEAGVDIIQSPYQATYWTCPQDIPDDPFFSIEGPNYSVSLEAAFRFDPTLGIRGEALRHVRGLECCNWCETTWGWADTNWKCWPRTFASAEIAWTGPNRTDFEDFLRRVAPLRQRLVRQYVGAAPITVHRDPRIVAAEDYEKPVSWKPSSINGLGVLSSQGSRTWDYFTDGGARNPPDWAMLKNVFFGVKGRLRLNKFDIKGNPVPEEKRYQGPYPIRIEDVLGKGSQDALARFEKVRPGQPFQIYLDGSRPAFLLTEPFGRQEDVAGFNAWRAKHPGFYAFYGYDEFDCDFGGYMWQGKLYTNALGKAAICGNFPYYEDRHLLSGAGWTATAQRLVKSYHFESSDLHGLYSVNLTAGHDIAQVGCKMLFYESELGSTSSPWRWGGMFVRGAARQFGTEWGWYTANYYQGFTRDGQAKDGFMHWPNPFAPEHVAYEGCSRSLTHRNNIYGYLIGASVLQLEGDPFCLYEKTKEPTLSPIGEDFESIFKWDQTHERGTTYSPVAFLISIDQPVNCQFYFSDDKRVSDKFSAAAFLMTLVPTYEPDTGLFSRRKEGDQGCLFNSPFGEIADTLCPDTDQDDGKFLAALQDYKAAFLIGQYDRKYLKAKALADYVKSGGTLFVSADQVHEGVVPAELAGISFDGEKTPCYEVVRNEQGWRAFQIYGDDGRYSLYIGNATTARPFLTDGRGKPATWINDYGKGRVYTVACRRMMPDEYADTGNHFERLRTFASGLRIFPFIRYLLNRVQNDVMPVTVTGDIQWGINKTSKGWMLWMINNRGCRKFWGEPEEIDPKAVSRVVVNLKALKGAKVTELTPKGAAGGLKVDEDIFTVDVAPCTVRTFAIE